MAKGFLVFSDTEKGGHSFEIYTDEAAAQRSAMDWLQDNWHNVSDDPCPISDPEQWSEAYQIYSDSGLSDYLYFIALELPRSPVECDLRGALGNLLGHVSQMQGMFSDNDGTIQSAIQDAEEALAA